MNNQNNTPENNPNKTFYICDPTKATGCKKNMCYLHGGPCYSISDKRLALEPPCEVELQCATGSVVSGFSTLVEKLTFMLHTAERHIAASSLDSYVSHLMEGLDTPCSDVYTSDIRCFSSDYVVMNTVGEAEDPYEGEPTE